MEPASGLRRALRRIQGVLHLLPCVIEALAGFLGGAFLMARGQARQHDAAGNNERSFTHTILSVGMNCRNDRGGERLRTGQP